MTPNEVIQKKRDGGIHTDEEIAYLIRGFLAHEITDYHMSAWLMAVYINMGADAVAILATSVMAAPCSLYLSKVVLPETGQPETRGRMKTSDEKLHRNVIDAVCDCRKFVSQSLADQIDALEAQIADEVRLEQLRDLARDAR